LKNKISYDSDKVINAGCASVTGLEMSQNSDRLSESREKVDRKLQGIMKIIFHEANEVSQKYDIPLYQGANIADFNKVADVMLAYMCV
jgi:glutamate dehydrogenase (NADP+)